MAKTKSMTKVQVTKVRTTNTAASQIPGWGSDLSPTRKPAVPKKENKVTQPVIAHWSESDRQVPQVKIHKSPEHPTLTPVFGTSCPPKGLSGLLRDFAYKFSEGRNVHWLTLLLADRINVLESLVIDLVRGHPDNPLSESGLSAEWKRHGLRSRLDQHRSDVKMQRNEVFLITGIIATIWTTSRYLKHRKNVKQSRFEEAA